MRRAAAFLALLLCLYWTRAQGESGGVTGNDITQTEVQSEILGVKATSDQTNITPDIWAELKELRDMVIEQKVELRNSKSMIVQLQQDNTGDCINVRHILLHRFMQCLYIIEMTFLSSLLL